MVRSVFLLAGLLFDVLFIFLGDGNVIVCVDSAGIVIGFVVNIRYNICAIFASKLMKIENNLKELRLNILEPT